MKKKRFLLISLLNLLLFVTSAQTIELIPNLNENDKNFWGSLLLKDSGLRIVYKGSMYFNYYNSSQQNQLARFDGEKISLVTNASRPDCFSGPEFILKDFLYLGICNQKTEVQLAKYDGAKTLIPIPNPDGFEFQSNIANLNGTQLLCYYETNENRYVIGQYTDEKISIIANSSFKGDSLVVFNNSLYFDHVIGRQIDEKHQLGTFDGSSVTLIPDPVTKKVVYSITPLIVFNNSLYLDYREDGDHQLGKCDGQKITFIPEPDKSWIYYNYNAIIYKNKLFILGYVGDNIKQGGQSQLAFLEGEKISLIANPTDGNCRIDALILYKDFLFFGFYSPEGKSQQLAKYDGTKITLISNFNINDPGVFGDFAIFNNDLYFGYENSYHKKQLAKYDGSKITLFSNSDEGVGFSGKLKVLNNILLFDYLNSKGIVQLAKYKKNLLK
jgi:hypothetical protein